MFFGHDIFYGFCTFFDINAMTSSLFELLEQIQKRDSKKIAQIRNNEKKLKDLCLYRDEFLDPIVPDRFA